MDDAIIKEMWALPLPDPMKDSTTYQRILREGRAEVFAEGYAEGRVEEARQMLIRMGTKRFGAPEAAALAALEAISDIDRLEDLSERLFDAEVRDWDGWLGSA